MPIETIVVKQISGEEESAINTAAAMVAALQSTYLDPAKRRLEALQVAFQNYPGIFTYNIGEEERALFWDGRLGLLKIDGSPIGEADPRVQLIVSYNITQIAQAFAKHLDELMQINQES